MSPAPWSNSNGPLTVVRNGYLVSADDGEVALVFTLEDARAVAALPEVVEALKKIAESAGARGERGTTGDGHQQAIQDARLALSKLEGKS